MKVTDERAAELRKVCRQYRLVETPGEVLPITITVDTVEGFLDDREEMKARIAKMGNLLLRIRGAESLGFAESDEIDAMFPESVAPGEEGKSHQRAEPQE